MRGEPEGWGRQMPSAEGDGPIPRANIHNDDNTEVVPRVLQTRGGTLMLMARPPKAESPTKIELVEGPEATDRFTDLTRKLVSVPKRDVDEAKAREGVARKNP